MWEARWPPVGASIAPDLFFVPLGAMLGRESRRAFWIPRTIDWNGCRARHPLATVLSWDLPYSLLGTSLAMAALSAWHGAALAAAYGLHIAVDYATHRGEWAVRPFAPFSTRSVQGFASAWEWPLSSMARAWGVLGALLAVLVVAR